MLFLSFIPFLSFLLVAAKKSNNDASNIHQKLVALAGANNGVIRLDDDSYNLLTSPNRNWSAVVQFTALKAFKCEPCKQLDPNFKTIGKSWLKVDPADRDQHFFASLDFEDGQGTFRKLGLNSAPIIILYPAAKGPRQPTTGRSDPVPLDLSTAGYEAVILAEQLSRHTPTKIPYTAPPNYAFMISAVSTVLTALLVARFILPILMSRWTWALITVGTMLIMVGGFMFVRIRGMPYAAQSSNGGTDLVSRGFQSQYGIEVQIVAFIYGLLSLSFLSMSLIIPRNTSPTRQRYAVYVWTAASIVLFSALISLFKIKNGGYPFRLLL